LEEGINVDTEQYKKLSRANIGYKCLKCDNWLHLERKCKIDKKPETCGREFDPHGGLGEKVPA